MSKIEWASAEVAGATLTVGLSGKPSKAWRQRVESVVERLGRDGVEVKKARIVVRDVRHGGEDELHHLLESAVLQANTDLDEEENGQADEPEDERSEADREMTAAFRAFAD